MPINFRGSCYMRPCPWDIGTRFSDSCSSICLTVSDTNDLPDPPEACRFALVQNLATGLQALYTADDVAWTNQVGALPTFLNGEITEVTWVAEAGWSLTINGVVPVVNPYVLAGGITSIEVVFINGGCSYAMEEIVAPAILPYGYFSISDPLGAGNDFLDWTINGEDFYLNQSVMQGFNGDAQYYTRNGTNAKTAILWYKGNTVPDIELLDGSGTPVAVTWTSVPDYICAEAVQTLADPAAIPTTMEFGEVAAIDLNVSISGDPINDPAFEAAVDAWMKQLFGPQASFTISFVGNDVTATLTGAFLTLGSINTFTPETIQFLPIVCP